MPPSGAAPYSYAPSCSSLSPPADRRPWPNGGPLAEADGVAADGAAVDGVAAAEAAVEAVEAAIVTTTTPASGFANAR